MIVMDIELDDFFQWQMPFSALLADIEIPESSIDDILDIELPDIIQDSHTLSAPVSADAESISPNSSFGSDKQTSSPLWSCDIPAPASNCKNLLPAVNTPSNSFPSISDPVGSPQSSTVPLPGAQSLTVSHEAPVTPPAAKPKRTRAVRASTKKSTKAKPKPEAAVAEPPKESRLPTQAEHIIRERQRRDDMAAKYSILESLLPPAAKRERAVVVEDAMSFVKNLQHKKSELLKRRAKLKLAAQHQSVNGLSPRHDKGKWLKTAHDSSGVITTSCVNQSTENCRTDSPISSSIMVRDLMVKPITNASEDLNIDAKPVHIYVHFSEKEIVIEMVWSQLLRNFHSFLLQAVESFGLDVTRCSLQRLTRGVVQCIITCTKSPALTTPSEIKSSGTLIEALRKVLIQP